MKMLSLSRSMTAAPNAQLNELAPHVGAALDSAPASGVLPMHMTSVSCDMLNSIASSFGLGGTIASAVFRSGGVSQRPVERLCYRRQQFLWWRPMMPTEGIACQMYSTCWCAMDAFGATPIRGGPCLLLAKKFAATEQCCDLSQMPCDAEYFTVVAAMACGASAAKPDALVVLEAVLALIQSQALAKVPPTVCLLTVGAQLKPEVCGVNLAGSIGLARSARVDAELPLLSIDFTFVPGVELVNRYARQPDDADMVVSREACLVPRLRAAGSDSVGHFRLHFHARGALTNLFIEPLPAFPALADSEVLLAVRAVGLNFRDVLNVLGEYPGDPGPPGADASGLVGPSATFGLCLAPLASVARAPACYVAPKPALLTFEQACTLPVTWSTAHVALQRAQLQASHRLIVHAAAGGVGLKTVEYAQWLHTRPLGTAGRPQKHGPLRSMGAKQMCSSRDASSFAWGAARLCEASRLQAVLNSLSLDFISVSLACLADGGAFLEIGKRSVWAPERHCAATPRTAYSAIALDHDMDQDPQWMHSVLVLLSTRADAATVTSLPLRSFDLQSQYELAFRMLQSGLNVGKVVVRVTARTFAVSGSHIVTGGTNGLGLLTGRWLAQSGASSLALASRSGVLSTTMAAECSALRASGARLHVERCDTAEVTHVRNLATQSWASSLSGVWHAAGVLSDGLLAKLSAPSLNHVYAPKAHGAWLLQLMSAKLPLRGYTLFSSIAALLGLAGQANYSAANACLDALAACRHTRGLISTCVQWGAWAEVGMASRGAASKRMVSMEAASGLGRITPAQGLAALQTAVHPCGSAVVGVVSIAWSRMLGRHREVPTFLSAFASESPKHTGATVTVQETEPQGCAVSLAAVLEMVNRTAGGTVDADAPLMEAGVDSLGAVELRSQLQSLAPRGASLPSTVVFDHPTARQLITLLDGEQAKATAAAPTVGRAPEMVSDARTCVGVRGLQALLPQCALGTQASWMLTCGRSLVGEVPPARWDLYAQPVQPEPIASRVRHGGFLYGAELVDNVAFGVSPAEAAAMDPQQRLLLECGYAALHTAALDRSALSGSLTGVFLGIASTEFAQLLALSPAGGSVYAATGSSLSIASGRLSYVLGLHGPCASYDTACSAALVACHAGLRAMQRTECTAGLVTGVNLMLTPVVGTSFSIAGMTSARGQCHTFDARADGFVRGEACGAMTLQNSLVGSQLSLCGCAVRQDGRSASLTAPNGQAQQGLLLATLGDAGLVASALTLNEAHGTGTALGDPIEAGSLAAAVLKHRDETLYLPVGGIKANIGHAEPAAGMTGLFKLALGLKHLETVPNAQLRVLNPHVDGALSGLPCALLAQLAGQSSEAATGGVSSFGYSGTIVHAVLTCTAGRDTPASLGLTLPRLAYKRRVFAWSTSVTVPVSSREAFTRIGLYNMCWVSFSSPKLQRIAWRSSAHTKSWLHLSSSAALVDTFRPAAPHGDASDDTRLKSYSTVAMTHNVEERGAAQLTAALTLLHVTRCTLQLGVPSFLLVTCGVHHVAPRLAGLGSCRSAHGGLWGFARVLRHEAPQLQLRCADLASRALCTDQSVCELVGMGIATDHGANNPQNEVVFSQSHFYGPRLRFSSPIKAAADMLPPLSGSFIVTGGFGGLGLRAVSLLGSLGASSVHLTSRSGTVARGGQGLESQLLQLNSLPLNLRAHAADTTMASDMCSTCQAAGSLAGFVHLASSFGGSLVTSEDSASLLKMHMAGPKPRGAWLLFEATRPFPIHTALMFSSLAALASSTAYSGTSGYSAANSYLDSLASGVRLSGTCALSIQMANVGGQGIGALVPERLASLPGMVRISLEEYTGCIRRAVSSSVGLGSLCTVLPASPAEVLREFEGTSVNFVSDHDAAAMQEGPLNRKLSTSARLTAARAALHAIDAAVGSKPIDMSFPREIVVIGAGLTGLAMGASLVQLGASTLVLEKRESVGGVWRWHGK